MINKIITLVTMSVVLTACSTKFKEKIGVVTTGPNEYKVQTNKPLDVPPHYDLHVIPEAKKENKNIKQK